MQLLFFLFISVIPNFSNVLLHPYNLFIIQRTPKFPTIAHVEIISYIIYLVHSPRINRKFQMVDES